MTTIAASLERCTLITLHERAPHTVPQADRSPIGDLPMRSDLLAGVAGPRLLRDSGLMSLDPVESNPNHYSVVFENDRVRVLEYTDAPGDKTTPHEHPDSVMYTLSAFRRRLYSGDAYRDVDMPAGLTGWLPGQQHCGENIGTTATHVIFVELKGSAAESSADGALGPV